MEIPSIKKCSDSFWDSCLGRAISSFVKMISNIANKIFGSCFGKKEEAKPIDKERVEVKDKSDLPQSVNPNTPAAPEPAPAAPAAAPAPAAAAADKPSVEVPKPKGKLEGALPAAAEAFAALPGDVTPAAQKQNVTVTFTEGGIARVKYSFKEGSRPYLEVKFSRTATPDLKKDLHVDEFVASHKYTDLAMMQNNWAVLNEKADFPEEVVDFISKKLGITA